MKQNKASLKHKEDQIGCEEEVYRLNTNKQAVKNLIKSF